MSANQSITQLIETTTPSANDVLPIVTNTDTTPVTKKVKFSNLGGGNVFGVTQEMGVLNPDIVMLTTAALDGSLITNFAMQPDQPQCLSLTITDASTVDITGTDYLDAVLTETSGTGTTLHAFKTVTSLQTPNSPGQTITLTGSQMYGLKRAFANPIVAGRQYSGTPGILGALSDWNNIQTNADHVSLNLIQIEDADDSKEYILYLVSY